ncbi:metal-sulfur cluster biosynthetic enzyme [Rhizobium sp. SG_E_25_P2]|uniref:metal-sulfur cluster assembly factor n=1 Tax=Rhizobium sp. SG_E_25_P2 TaxID=2879942 RepID=UPI00247409EE|nr:metal-sulfur cluster assembly factor [Rhizobium sp. SG_E_25_P2]MDH6268183.1 metal-sulfur cluster biosynthetic enzyme [Rhizobium sp. SG_E_25_P2]
MTADLVPEIAAALAEVIDPELGLSVIDIGLIYGAEAMPKGGLRIVMTTTTRGCPAAGLLVEAVRERALASGLAASVEVELTYDPPWTPDRMRA